MADITTILAKLKKEAEIEPSEQFDDADDLIPWIEEAVSMHRADIVVDDLPDNEIQLVVLLAWAKVCLIRANKAAKVGNSSGGQGYGQDHNTPYAKNISLADKLIARYKMLVERLGTDSSGDIIQGTLYRKEDLIKQIVPVSSSPFPPKVSLKMSAGESATVGTSLVIEWTTRDYDDFREFVLFHYQGSAPLTQKWNYSSASGFPQIHDAAVQLWTSYDFTVRSIKIDGIDKSVTHRYVLVNRNQTGKITLSNELVIGP